ncbi:MAG: hypothetical protein IJ581_06325 [Paludibacteraceae bacterium]|nr:hypothetical protein [Paludibacteraceae bacterium]
MKKMYKEPQTQTAELRGERLMDGNIVSSTVDHNPEDGISIPAPGMRVMPPAAPAPLQ